ncbi:hypothetical protein O181_047774 [Austropuccinia psidii MF-1]|uniref:Uncharacterized protein n=1 Tax=Austropuccinia psidii MF-1 TaxID=1389203 RepID=A0A9Q3HMD2_9BASI|nr:hypothetical protein [Austropuccinia psidii MF-1]
MHELLPEFEEVTEPSQSLAVASLVASMYVNQYNYAFNSRMEEKSHLPLKQAPSPIPVASISNSKVKNSHKLRSREITNGQPPNNTSKAAESQNSNKIPWEMCFRWPEKLWK